MENNQMPQDNIEQLKKLGKVFNADKIITTDEIQQVLEGIVKILASYKQSTEQLNQETKAVVAQLLDKVEETKIAADTEITTKKDSVIGDFDTKKEAVIVDFNKKIAEVRSLLETVRAIKLEKPAPQKEVNKDEIVQAVLKEIKLPEYKAFELVGEDIVASINALDLDNDDLKIDWKRIKNVPKNFGTSQNQWVGSPIRYFSQMEDFDGTTAPTNGQVPIWNSTTKKWTPGAGGGGGGSLALSVDGTPNADQTILNLISSGGVAITDNGGGDIVIDGAITAPGGSSLQLQFNNGGIFSGISGATSNGTDIFIPTLYGGSTAAASLTLASTSHATKGVINIGNSSYNEATDVLTMGGVITSAYNVTANGFLGSSGVRAGAASAFYWSGRTQIFSPSDGVILMQNAASTDFTRLQFGGTTSSFPAIKRTTTALNFRLADDSADAAITAAGATLSGASTIADTIGAGSGSLAGSALSVTQTWNTSGAPTAIKLNVTNTASGAAALLADLQVGGVSQFSVSKGGAIVIPGNITLNTLLAATAARVGSTGQFYWNSRSQIYSPADGQIRLTDAAGTSFDRLQFGGTTSSFPAIKRSSAALVARLADNSADADFTAARLISTNIVRLKGYTVATLPAGTTGDVAYCTDLLTPTFFTAAVGGGAVVGSVFYNGTTWVCI